MFDAFLKAIPEPVFLVDCHGILLQANAAMEQLLPKGLAGSIGCSIYDGTDADFAERLRKHVDQALGSGKACQFTHFEDSRSLEYHVYPMVAENTLTVMAVDITGHKSVENMLRASQDKLLRIFDSAGDEITVTDLHGTIVEANERAARNRGFSSKKAMVGKTGFAMVAPREHDRMMRLMKQTLAEGSITGMELALLKADGSEYVGEVSVSILQDTRGNPIGLISITRDITERRRSELALAESEEKLRGLYSAMHEGVCLGEIVYNESGKPVDNLVQDVNPAMESITGHSRDEIVGRLASEFYDIPPYLDIHAEVADSRKTISYETYFPPLQKHFQVSAFSPAKGRFAVVFSDVSRYKEIESRLLEYQKELRSLASELSLAEERERRRIAGEVHDRVSQTLALCRIKLGALGEAASAAGLAEPVTEIRTIIEQLIDETRSLTFQISSPLLYEFGLEAALEHLAAQMQKTYGLAFQFEDDEQAKPLDDDIRVLLFQMVRELMINVTKSAHASYARISLKKDGNSFKITVADDGIGFDTSQIHSKWKASQGYGLFGIRERLETIGGQLNIESGSGLGTRITISVPLKESGGQQS